MKTEQLMTRAPRVCMPTATLNDAAGILWEADCGMLPVVDRVDGLDCLVGVLTDRDICMAAYTTGKSLKEIPVERAMSTELSTCSPEASIETAEKTMRESQIRRLPVVDGAGAIVGVLSLADIAREAQSEHGLTKAEVTASEVGVTLGEIAKPHAIAAA